MSAVLRLSVGLLAASLLGGCAIVQPWERGVLAHHTMDPDSGAQAANDDWWIHCTDVREAATGGTGSAGGGCGCN